MIELIRRVRLVTARQLVGVLGAPCTVRNAQRLMARLAGLGLVGRMDVCLGRADRDRVWHLTRRGHEFAVATYGGEVPIRTTEHAIDGFFPLIEHSLLVTDVLLAVYAAAPLDEALRSIRSVIAGPETELRYAHPRRTGATRVVVPDAIITLVRGGERVFIEADRGTKSLKRIAANIAAYAQYFRAGVGGPAMVAYVTPSRARRDNLRALFQRSGVAFRWDVFSLAEARQGVPPLAGFRPMLAPVRRVGRRRDVDDAVTAVLARRRELAEFLRAAAYAFGRVDPVYVPHQGYDAARSVLIHMDQVARRWEAR